MDDIQRNGWYRLFEIFPGAMTWTLIIGPIIAAFWFPRVVAIYVMMYVLFWFLRSLKSSMFLIYSYRKSKKFEKIDWNNMLDFFSDSPPLPITEEEKTTLERTHTLHEMGKLRKAKNIIHVVIMPTFKEEKEILETSIETLTQVNYPPEQIIFVLATEQRDRMHAETNASYLKKKFGHSFGDFFHFMHPSNIEGELPAKGANISYAGQQIAKILKDRGVDFGNVIVTTLDADNRPHPFYFSILTYHYLMEPKRDRRSFQPLAFFYNNIWEVPFINRIVGLANTFWYLAESGESNHLFNASVYAQSLETLVAIDFWSRQTIVEDLHQYWRMYFHFNGDHEVIPLFVPVYQDALENRTYFTSLVGQYRQLRRWAWGASEIPYAIIKTWKHRKTLPLFRSINKVVYLCSLQIMWASAPIIVLLNNAIPTILNPEFSKSVFAFNTGQILDIIFKLMLTWIVVSLWISLLSLPRPRGRFGTIQFIFGILQWILLPIVTIFYGAIPAIDAQTRLMLNRPLAFTVTEKIRKINSEQ